MRRLISAIAIAITVACAAPAWAQSARPWEAHTELLDRVNADINAKGAGAIAPHVDDLKRALAEAPAAYAAAATGDGKTRYALADGSKEALAASIALAAAGEKAGTPTNVVAVRSPYPTIAYIIGFHFVDIGKFDEAAQALDAGVKLPSLGFVKGATQPMLLMELGVAYGQLKRYADSVASFEAALAIDDLTDRQRARALRGRGISLIDLERFDEAESDLKKSLVFEPGNAAAIGELEYLGKMRQGGTPVGRSVVTTPQ